MKVKRFPELGVLISAAIPALLPKSSAALGERCRLAKWHFSECIDVFQRDDRIRAVLAEELVVKREWLDGQLNQFWRERAEDYSFGQHAGGS